MAEATNQHTLAGPASLEGTSLHTGEKVTLTMKPAPVDHGIRFCRMDEDDHPIIPAHVDNVEAVERRTTLSVGGVRVHTVEHVISALSGMGVDNALVEMTANEPPIGDGSSLPFVECIKKAGLEEQDAPRRIFEVREPIHLETKNGSLITIVPDNKFRISCTQVGPDGTFTQYNSFEINPETYEKEIAPARTFVFYEDVQPLLEKGLIKGGSLENAVVVKEGTIMSKDEVRFTDEFVRHKILDIVGDLLLCGRRIKGHVIAVKPGHGPNTEMAAKLSKKHTQMRSMVPPVKIPTGEAVLDVNEVMRLLPHRYPFLMVDRVVDVESDMKATGVKNVSIGEPYFEGHFPDHPVMPGVLQLEAMAQVASILLLRQESNQGKIGYFMKADKVKWRKPVFPGDTLFIHAEITRIRGMMGQASCHCTVNDEIVSEGELMFALLDD